MISFPQNERFFSKRFVFVFFVSLIVCGCSLLTGCGSASEEEELDTLAEFVINNLVIPVGSGKPMLIYWIPTADELERAPSESDMKRVWKYENGDLKEITYNEFTSLKGSVEKAAGYNAKYTLHSLSILSFEEGSAQVEIASMFNPMSGTGTIYTLTKENGAWRKVSERSSWHI